MLTLYTHDDETNLSVRLQAAYARAGDTTCAKRLAVCHEGFAFRPYRGQAVLTDDVTSWTIRARTQCHVHGCPRCGGVARDKQSRQLQHLVVEAEGAGRGAPARFITLTVPSTVGPQDLRARVEYVRSKLTRLFASRAWRRCLPQAGGGWCYAIEIKWNHSAVLNVHVHLVVSAWARKRRVRDAMRATWCQLVGASARVRVEDIEDVKAISKYMTKGLAGTAKRRAPAHLYATDSDLDAIVAMSIGSGTPERKRPVRLFAFLGAWRGRKPARKSRSLVTGRGARPRRETPDERSAVVHLAGRARVPDGLPVGDLVLPVFDRSDLNRYQRHRRRHVRVHRRHGVVHYQWERSDEMLLV